MKENLASPAALFQILHELAVEFQKIDHPAVFTVEESKHIIGELTAQGTKNLFLQEEKTGKFFFLIVAEEKKVDLKRLRSQLQTNRFSFAKADSVRDYLKVEPGSLTMMSLLFAEPNAFQCVVDEQVMQADFVSCHPLVNTSTIIFSQADWQKLIHHAGHKPIVLAL